MPSHGRSWGRARVLRGLLMSLHSSPDTLNPLVPKVEQIIGPLVVFVQITIGLANDIKFMLLKSDALGVLCDMYLQESRSVILSAVIKPSKPSGGSTQARLGGLYARFGLLGSMTLSLGL